MIDLAAAAADRCAGFGVESLLAVDSTLCSTLANNEIIPVMRVDVTPRVVVATGTTFWNVWPVG